MRTRSLVHLNYSICVKIQRSTSNYNSINIISDLRCASVKQNKHSVTFSFILICTSEFVKLVLLFTLLNLNFHSLSLAPQKSYCLFTHLVIVAMSVSLMLQWLVFTPAGCNSYCVKHTHTHTHTKLGDV
jgi:hypothetical protein